MFVHSNILQSTIEEVCHADWGEGPEVDRHNFFLSARCSNVPSADLRRAPCVTPRCRTTAPHLPAKGSQVAAETAESAEISEHDLRADVSAVSAVSAAHKSGLTCQRRTGLPPLGPDGFAASRRNQPDLVSDSTRLSV